jgi:uncharacterized protein (TIGR02246 family)
VLKTGKSNNKPEVSMMKPSNPVQFILNAILLVGVTLAALVQQGIVLAAQPAGAAAEGAAAQSKPAAAAPTAGREADEKAIRATADDFVKAFNAADAKAIGALWAADAEYTDESGKSFHGGAAIEKLYAGLFREHRGVTMTVTIESIRFFGPDVAVEKGVTQLASPAGEKSAARYTVVHARRDGKWIMVDCRDTPCVPGSNADCLRDLEWLIGQWRPDVKDEKGETRRITFEWMCERNFIKSSFTAVQDDKTTLNGGQIIGWNPKLGKIVSLHFDAQGGFGNDAWIKDGSKWVIEASGVFRNGSESRAVNIVTPIDANSFTWQSVQRTLDGVKLPDTPPVKIVRVQAGK